MLLNIVGGSASLQLLSVKCDTWIMTVGNMEEVERRLFYDKSTRRYSVINLQAVIIL